MIEIETKELKVSRERPLNTFINDRPAEYLGTIGWPKNIKLIKKFNYNL